jgi:3-dehydroquinate dehydratase
MNNKKVVLEDLSDVFGKEAIKTLHKGDLLRFNYEGSITEFIITRLNKKSHIVIGRETTTHLPDAVTIDDAYGEIETFKEMMESEDER